MSLKKHELWMTGLQQREACWCWFGKWLKDERLTRSDILAPLQGEREGGTSAWKRGGGVRWVLAGTPTRQPPPPLCSVNLSATQALISRMQSISRGSQAKPQLPGDSLCPFSLPFFLLTLVQSINTHTDTSLAASYTRVPVSLLSHSP